MSQTNLSMTPSRFVRGIASVGLVLGALGLGIALGPAVQDVMSRGEGAHGDHGSADGEEHYFTCGMHPWVILPKAGLCPICQMDLVPIDPSKLSGQLSIDPVVVQNMGVRVAEVRQRPVRRSLRAVGTVVANEQMVRDIVLKSEGFVEKLAVRSMGETVRAGDVLLELYSPMLVTAQQEFLESLRSGADPDLLQASRARLRNLDVPDAVILDLEAKQIVRRTIPVVSMYDGVVVEKMVWEGARIMPGMPVLRVADLSSVWVEVEFYEQDLPMVQKHQFASVETSWGETFSGEVAFVYSMVDMDNRQAKVRILLENPDTKLLPGMFVSATVQVGAQDPALTIPDEAVLHTGQRTLVLVSLGAGRFEPREVEVGIPTDDGEVPIRHGLAEGELVVTSGQFLLDSEIRLREGLARMLRGTPAPIDPIAPKPPALPQGTAGLPPDALPHLEGMVRSYLTVADTLTRDSTAEVGSELQKLIESGNKLSAFSSSLPELHKHVEAGIAAAARTREATTLEAVRESFFAVSDPLIAILSAVGTPPAWKEGLVVHHCPMYREEQGGVNWVAAPGKVRNPYYGSQMLGCSDDTRGLPMWQAPAPVDGSLSVKESTTLTPHDSGHGSAGGPYDSPAGHTPDSTGGPKSKEIDKPSGESDKKVAAALPPDAARTLDSMVRTYLEIASSFSDDSDDMLVQRLGNLSASAQQFHGFLMESQKEGSPVIFDTATFHSAIEEAKSASDLKSKRRAFTKVSDILIVVLREVGVPLSFAEGLVVHHCPMFRKDQGGADWIQENGPVRNPYFGSGMLRCKTKTESLPLRGGQHSHGGKTNSGNELQRFEPAGEQP